MDIPQTEGRTQAEEVQDTAEPSPDRQDREEVAEVSQDPTTPTERTEPSSTARVMVEYPPTTEAVAVADMAQTEVTVSTAPEAEVAESSAAVAETAEDPDLLQEVVEDSATEPEAEAEDTPPSQVAEVVVDSEPPRSPPTEAPTGIRSTGSTTPTGGTEPPERSASVTSVIERKT